MPSDPQEYKIVLAEPTSNDPPDNPVATWDNMIGINPPYQLIKDLSSPYDYGAIGDGVVDDTVAMQAWLDAIAGTAGYWQTGTYLISSTLYISGNTTIYGAGAGVATLTSSAEFPSNAQLLINKSFTSSGPKQVGNIAIYGVTFSGSSTQEMSAEMVGWGGVDRLILRDCKFQHWRRHLTTYANCSNVQIDNCEFYDWGSLTVVPEPGMCLYDGGYAMWFGMNDSNFKVTNCYIHDGQWTAILIGADTNSFATIDGNLFQNAMEAFIFGGIYYASITNNKFTGLRQKDCSGQGIEISGLILTIQNNEFHDIAESCVYLTNSVLCNISGNVFNTPNQLFAPTVGTSTGAITLRSASGFDRTMDRVQVCNNTFSSADLRSSFGIALYDYGGGPMTNVLIENNNLSPSAQWLTAPIFWDDPTVRGTGFMVRNNNGAPTSDISTITATFIIPAGTTGSFTVAGVGFQPSRITFQAVLNSTSTASGNSLGQQVLGYVWNVASSTVSVARTTYAASGMTWAANGTAGFSNDITGDCSICVREPDGTPICVAHATAFNDDGFTLTIISATDLAVDAGGTGYAVNDVGTITSGDNLGTYRVLAESGGVVTSVMYTGGGTGIGSGSGVATVATTGGGAGLTLDITVAGDPTAEAVVVNAICSA